MPLKGRKYGDSEDGAELYGSGFEKKEVTAVTTTSKAAAVPVETTETFAEVP